VSIREIADLLAWARRLTETPPATTQPGEAAAYQTHKADLLERLTPHPDTTTTDTDPAGATP